MRFFWDAMLAMTCKGRGSNGRGGAYDSAPVASETRPAAGDARRIARNTAIFSVATGLSRIAGLVREIVAASYFGTRGAFSAFTVAFQVPNIVRTCSRTPR